MRNAIALVVFVGCGYTAGSFRDPSGPFVGTAQTIGCLDVSVGATRDPIARGPVIAYGFGNRCAHPVTVDLATVRAVGQDAEGRERVLAAFDPRGELRPLPLDGLWSGREQIEYVAVEGASIVSVCVDIGGIDASAPRRERWVCTDHHVELAP